MIRRATENDFQCAITNESALRIFALKCAYGLDAPFIQYFSDNNGSLAAIMDGFCAFSCADELDDEWRTFFAMQPAITVLHTEERIARAFVQNSHYYLTNGEVLRLEHSASSSTLHQENPDTPRLNEVYEALQHTFSSMPRFDAWYVDASHRIRHGCCHIVGKYVDKTLASVAMTVAEANDVVLIGGVATLPSYRKQGLASNCIMSLISQLSQQTILIAPNSAESTRLYQKLGFVPYGTWAEVTLLPQEG